MLLNGLSWSRSTPPRPARPDTQPYGDDYDHAEHRLRAGIPNAMRDLRAQEVRKPDVHSDPADTSDERSQDKYPESHSEDSGHKGWHRHGCHEVIPAENTIALGEQLPARFLANRPGWSSSQRPLLIPISYPTTEPSIQATMAVASTSIRLSPAFAGQRARPDQRRITQARDAGPHDRDEHEQDDVFGQAHGCVLSVIVRSRHRSTVTAFMRPPGTGGTTSRPVTASPDRLSDIRPVRHITRGGRRASRRGVSPVPDDSPSAGMRLGLRPPWCASRWCSRIRGY